MSAKLTIQEQLKHKRALSKASFILDEQEYNQLNNLLTQKNFKDARKFLDYKIENCNSESELLVLKEVEDFVFDLTNN